MRDNFIFDPSLALYLPLHQLDGTSIMDRSAYGHLCTVTGTTWGLQGRILDGTDDVITIPAAVALRLVGNWTILFWIKTTEPDNNVGVYTDNNGGGAGEVDLNVNAGKLRFSIAGIVNLIQSTTTITTGDWFFCGLTADDSKNYTIFINSIAEATDTNAWTLNAFGNNLIGKASSAEYLSATIGDFLIYQRLLSASEIQHNQQVTKWRYQ